jgi:hypothetical protein
MKINEEIAWVVFHTQLYILQFQTFEQMKISSLTYACHFYDSLHSDSVMSSQQGRPVRRGVSKGEEDGCRPPALQAGHPPNGCKAVLGVARPQGV